MRTYVDGVCTPFEVDVCDADKDDVEDVCDVDIDDVDAVKDVEKM